MLLQLSIASILLFEATTSAGKIKDNERDVSFSVEKTWNSYQNKDSYTCHSVDKWKEGVQDYYTGVRRAYWTFKGPSYDLADNVIVAFEKYLTKLIYFTNTNSTILTSSSTAILVGFSKLNKLKTSGLEIIKEFNNVFPVLVEMFKEVVTKLSNIIGDLSFPINDALDDFAVTLGRFQKNFLKTDLLGNRKKVDYKPVIEQGQIIVNTIALITETLLNECVFATREVYEAVTVLNLILVYFVIVVQGINACQQSVLYAERRSVPPKIELCSVSLEYAMVELTESVTSITMPLTESLTACLTNIVNIIMFLNLALRDVLGLFKGVAITVGQITRNLTKSVISHTVTDVTNGLSNLLKGIALK